MSHQKESILSLYLAIKQDTDQFLSLNFLSVHTTSRVSTVSDLIPVSAYHSPNVPSSGVRVSPGTLIIIPIEALGRDPKVWGQDADEFRPERWFDSNNEGSKRYTRAGGMAFLSGSRACIGNRFGEHEHND